VHSAYVCNKYEVNTDFKGDDLTTFPISVNSPERCLSVCSFLDQNQCTGFTFEEKTKTCFLKKFTQQPVRIQVPGSIIFF